MTLKHCKGLDLLWSWLFLWLFHKICDDGACSLNDEGVKGNLAGLEKLLQEWRSFGFRAVSRCQGWVISDFEGILVDVEYFGCSCSKYFLSFVLFDITGEKDQRKWAIPARTNSRHQRPICANLTHGGIEGFPIDSTGRLGKIINQPNAVVAGRCLQDGRDFADFGVEEWLLEIRGVLMHSEFG